MFHVIYLVFIYPIEFIIKTILETAYNFTGNYGFSLIILSICISLILLPFYRFTEYLQNRERKVRNKMQSQIDDLKSVYKGYEQHLYLKALYRQNNYHPLLALQASLGLLIQLPFFIAAYHFISGYELLNGVVFWIFRDLGNPDGLIETAGMNINIMPAVMIFFNLSGAYYYGKNLSSNEKYQMYFVALLFFILLYNSPAGLLIYWTCNNIFSFIKYIIIHFMNIRSSEKT